MSSYLRLALGILPGLFLFGCSNTDKKNPLVTETESVEIELSVPHSEGKKSIYLGCDSKPISVIFHNNTDSIVRMYEDWNSWGYYNISFEITTNDSIYILQKGPGGWWKNFPSYNAINPGESLVFNFVLEDSFCFPHRKVIRGSYRGWNGLPHKNYDSAKIRVLYELKDGISLQMVDSVTAKDPALQRSFLSGLTSKQYDVRIVSTF